jgi:hypothetical protein
MPLRRAFAPMLPEFDSFLFAAVGEERDGIPLSVMSALSRLGLDPRDEAARLSHLTKEAAADQLARMIARLSDRRWPLSEARRIAGGLIERLPTSSTGIVNLSRGWYASSVGGAVARCGEVLWTPIGLTPSQPRGAGNLTSTPLS